MTTKQIGFVPTTNRGKMIRKILTENGGRMFSVTFRKKDNTIRTLTGNYGHVQAQSGGNNAGHYEKYVCVILPEKDAKGNPLRRNVNCETVLSITTNGVTMAFEDTARA